MRTARPASPSWPGDRLRLTWARQMRGHRLAGSKKAELRVAGAREKGAASTLQSGRELPQTPAAHDWLRASGECQASLALVEVGQTKRKQITPAPVSLTMWVVFVIVRSHPRPVTGKSPTVTTTILGSEQRVSGTQQS
ncbi:hypothetical protein EYF80_021540 [Liparis tanakae]|uniref:Uncharacterized protein n=1 Tax=Liparis tanakae TaxID=230148 RepID=A0A4Z2HR44_9TELE|nr:hypothetical protein EYF80_021540 [Liparis tanakae]